MPKMGSYCKAYPVARFREFGNWSEKVPPLVVPSGTAKEGESSGEAVGYFYLQENFTVTAGIFLDENVTFDQVTPEWTEFCESKLEFQVPDFSARPTVGAAVELQNAG